MKAIEKKPEKRFLKELGFDTETMKALGELLKSTGGTIHFYLEHSGPHITEDLNKKLSTLHSDADMLKLKHSLLDYKTKTLEQALNIGQEVKPEEKKALAREVNALKHDLLVLNSETLKAVQEIKRETS